MEFIIDGLMIVGTLFAGIYCWVLAGRVRALKSLDTGLGASIVTLTRQIELARTTLEESRRASGEGAKDLDELVGRAESASRQLRLLLAAASKEPAGRAARASAARLPEPEPQPVAAPVAEAPPPRAPDPEPPRREAVEPEPRTPAWAPAQIDLLAARRRASPGPRLVALPQIRAEDPPADPPAADRGGAQLPKPRHTHTAETVLRRRAAGEDAILRTEEDLIAALSALAAGGER